MIATQQGGPRLILADGLMLGTVIIWGINVTSVKIVVGVIPPLGFGLLRYASATCLLGVILKWREGTVCIGRADLVWVALAGAIGFGLNQMAFLLGVRLISASLTALILATAPLLTAVLAAAWAREPLHRRTLLALLVSLAGVVVVLAGGGAAVHVSLPGGVLIVGAAAALALSAVLAKRPLRTYSSLRVTAWMSLFGSLTLLPLGLPALVAAPWTSLTPLIVAAITFTVVGSTVLGNVGWNYAIQKLGAARTSIYTYVQPVVGVLIAAVLLGERLTLVQLLGGGVVLLGLVLYPQPH